MTKLKNLLLFQSLITLIFFGVHGCSETTESSNTKQRSVTDGGIAADAQPSQNPKSIWNDLEDCQLTGRLYIDKVEYTGTECGDLDIAENDALVISEKDGFASLRLGAMNLPISDLTDCKIMIDGCKSQTEEGHLNIVRGTLEPSVSGVRLNLSVEAYEAWRKKDCQSIELEAQANPSGCQLSGKYLQSETATLSSGRCDLSWDEATITIAKESITEGVLSWGEPGSLANDFANIMFDETECSLTASRDAVFFYNGSVRETTISAQIDEDTLTLTIQDSLDEADNLGNQCQEGLFEATATRITPDAANWSASCEPLPYVCGDSVCSSDAGENCSNCEEDCGCGDGDFCYRYMKPEMQQSFACTRVCDIDPSICDAGESCVLAQEFGGGVDLALRVCLPGEHDSGEVGSPCVSSFDCKAELVCSDGACRTLCEDRGEAGCMCNYRYGIYACHRSCSRMAPDNCGPGGYCGESLGARQCSGAMPQNCYPHPQHETLACFPGQSYFGDPCAKGIGCGLDLACVGEDCLLLTEGGVECATEVCSRECTDSSDCAAPLPYCWTHVAGGKSFCVSTQVN